MNKPSAIPAGIYIHIPFCESLCPYCDFYSVLADDSVMERFINSLNAEAVLRSADYDSHTFDSVYFGGGTPSRLGPDRIGSILDSLKSHYKILDDTEITMECNPSTVAFDAFRKYMETGVNRISIGIQSFDNDNLKALGRIHDSTEAREALASARKAGFNNINMDLIYGIPGQTLSGWENDLKSALELAPEHISAYNLIIEPDTPFGELYRRGELILPPDDLQKDMYYALIDLSARGGFKRYELSNFAANRLSCRHNLKYWKNIPFLGLGPSGVSYDGSIRSRNFANLDMYCELISSGKSPAEYAERINRETAIEERVMMGLRLAEGLSLRNLIEEFGYDLAKEKKSEIDNLMKTGYLVLDGERLRIARNGLFISDEITVKLI